MTEQKATVLLEHHLKALKLPTMLREYTPLAAACSQEKADYATFGEYESKTARAYIPVVVLSRA